MLFAPTDAAVANLEREGITGERVHRTGDVQCDIALAVVDAARERRSAIATALAARHLELPEPGRYAVATIHRAANTEPDALAEVLECLRAVARELPVILPLHPRTQSAAERAGLHLDLASIPDLIILPPLGYVDMTSILVDAKLVVTDSGGLQKEAFIHGVPCITLRDRTEWTETVDAGWNVVVGRDPVATSMQVEHLAETFGDKPWLIDRPDLYGNGHAADQMLDVLARHARVAVPFELG
jgi:UDP-N-acetylglucosamine 2-epimerase